MKQKNILFGVEIPSKPVFCEDPEIGEEIAHIYSGGMDEKQRTRFEEHYPSCERCQYLIALGEGITQYLRENSGDIFSEEHRKLAERLMKAGKIRLGNDLLRKVNRED